ncbi:MAG: caspase family protein [Alphaproteobacteria bacterium]|nr:caspase family protein [Alphaproteobacteria bacterium]
MAERPEAAERDNRRASLEERLENVPVGPYDGRYKGEVNFSITTCGKVELDFGIINSELVFPRERDPEYLDVPTLNGRIDESGRIEGIVTIGQYNYPFIGTVKDGKVSGAVYARKLFCNGVLYEADIFWNASQIKKRVAAVPADAATAEPESTAALDADPPKQEPEPAPKKSSSPKKTTKAASTDKVAPVIAAPDELIAKTSSITLSGTVTDASAIVDFTIDGKSLALENDGAFSIKRGVPQGDSQITLAATDEWGNVAIRVIQIRREAQVAAKDAAEPVKTVPAVTAIEELDELSQSIGKFSALIIGNDNYKHLPKLKTATADATALAELLERRYGFKTTVLKNATRRDVLAALASLRTTLRFDDNLVIYYAGHGYLDEVTERGYWLPVDAEADNPANWISNADVTDMLKALPSRAVLVIADSCYAGTLTRAIVPPAVGGAGRRAFLERVAAKRARTVLASGGLEPVADSGGGKHSVFSKALLDILSENDAVIDAQSLFAPIRQRVVLNAEQTPEYSDVRLAGHEGGEFIFVPR